MSMTMRVGTGTSFEQMTTIILIFMNTNKRSLVYDLQMESHGYGLMFRNEIIKDFNS